MPSYKLIYNQPEVYRNHGIFLRGDLICHNYIIIKVAKVRNILPTLMVHCHFKHMLSQLQLKVS